MRIAHLTTWSMLSLVMLTSAAWTHGQEPKPAPAARTAAQFYLAYRAAFDKATKLEDILPYLAAKNRKAAEAMPAAERDPGFQMIKAANALTGVRVLKEEKTAAGVMLTVEGVDSVARPDQHGVAVKKKNTGTVMIVKEGGAWKVGDENWIFSS